MGQSEIQTSVIGKKVMEFLKELDKILKIRFASVYTNFKEVEEFEEYIEKLDVCFFKIILKTTILIF